ncbi:hypothetical protein ABVT39_015475 [Epinephelus coioides]
MIVRQDQHHPPLTLSKYDIEYVKNFTYLGSNILSTGDVEKDVRTRIGKAAGVFQRLHNGRPELSLRPSSYTCICQWSFQQRPTPGNIAYGTAKGHSIAFQITSTLCEALPNAVGLKHMQIHASVCMFAIHTVLLPMHFILKSGKMNLGSATAVCTKAVLIDRRISALLTSSVKLGEIRGNREGWLEVRTKPKNKNNKNEAALATFEDVDEANASFATFKHVDCKGHDGDATDKAPRNTYVTNGIKSTSHNENSWRTVCKELVQDSCTFLESWLPQIFWMKTSLVIKKAHQIPGTRGGHRIQGNYRPRTLMII